MHLTSLVSLLVIALVAPLTHGIDERLSRYTIIPTPNPQESFSEQPVNVTVPEGEVAVMRCKVIEPVTQCRWFYTELGNDFYDTSITPKSVKVFNPIRATDCSIRFTVAKKIQEGQWLCQARKYMSTTYYNTRPATLRVITDAEENEYLAQGGQFSPPDMTRDPPAPTAIPAVPPPNNGEEEQKVPEFEYHPEDQIQNTKTGEEAVLKCKVDMRVDSCSWTKPNGEVLRDQRESRGGDRLNTPTNNSENEEENYTFISNRENGDCSLSIKKVQHHDEGNWRCGVSVPKVSGPPLPRAVAASASPSELQIMGPLIHLHLLDFPHHVMVKPDTSTNSTDYTLIALLMVALVLFIIGALIIFYCYKKVWSKQQENPTKEVGSAAKNTDPEYTQQWFQGRNLKIVDPNYTDDFKLRSQNDSMQNAGAPIQKNSGDRIIKYSDLDHYNQYIAMNQGLPGSVRSSTSSNTTLSTVLVDPMGRDRSISFGANSNTGLMSYPGSPTAFSHLHGHNPDQQVPFYEVHRNLHRPISLYSTGHLYEEIQDKMAGQIAPHNKVDKHGNAVQQDKLVTTPVYTNVVEDGDGYLIPNRSSKIVNTPREEVAPQYLVMHGSNNPTPNSSFNTSNTVKLNNLSQNPGISEHVQAVPEMQKRNSSTSVQSQEDNMEPLQQNYQGGHYQTKVNNSPVPNSRIQNMPLPNPTGKVANQPLQLQNREISRINKNSITAHQRTSSLPDTSNSIPSGVNHAKSPSLVPQPENYDVPSNNTQVPRKLASVPKSVNGSEISLNNIDGTIV